MFQLETCDGAPGRSRLRIDSRTGSHQRKESLGQILEPSGIDHPGLQKPSTLAEGTWTADAALTGTFSRLLKNAHLLRFPDPSSLRRTIKYASFLRISGALHLSIFEQPVKNDFSRILPSIGLTDLLLT